MSDPDVETRPAGWPEAASVEAAAAPVMSGPPPVAEAPPPDVHTDTSDPGGGPEAPATGRVQIIVAEDEALFRDLLAGVLSATGDVEVIGAYPDAEAAIEATRRLHPKVVVLDIELGGALNGIQAGLLIRRDFPDVGIVWLSAYKRPFLPVSFQQQMTTGWAYLLKKSGTDVRTLAAAIDGVAKGLVVLDPEIADSMNRLLKHWIPLLSPAQYDVLALMAQGLGNAAIARALNLPEKSVESQVNQIYHHLHLNGRSGTKHRRVEAVLIYLRERNGDTASTSPGDRGRTSG